MATRTDVIEVKMDIAEVKAMVIAALVVKYPTIAGNPITVDTRGLMDSVSLITVEIITKAESSITLP